MAAWLPSGGRKRTRACGERRSWVLAVLGILLASTRMEGFQTPMPIVGLPAKYVRLQSARRRGGIEGVNGMEARVTVPAADGSGDKDDPRRVALDGVMLQIERCYGRGSIQTLGHSGNELRVATDSTGCLTLDVALGGGLPKGRIVEIFGHESSGKTTLALHALAEVQKRGGVGAFIDAEHALDPTYAKNIGLDVDELLVSQPDSGEMALDVVDQLVRSSAVDMVVIDSVAALVPRAELEGDMADMQMGLQARLMSKAMRKVTGSLAKSTCTVVFLNQLRSKIGIIYGSPEVTSGGNALKYYSSVRIDVRRKETMRNNVGITVKVKIVKNKVAPPFRQVELDILFGKGLDMVASLLDAAEMMGVVTRKGSWYSYDGANFAQGRLNAVDYLKNDNAALEELNDRVRQKLLIGKCIDVPQLSSRQVIELESDGASAEEAEADTTTISSGDEQLGTVKSQKLGLNYAADMRC